MAAPIRERGETRNKMINYLKNGPRTRPEIAAAVGIGSASGHHTLKRMIDVGTIREAGYNDRGVKLYELRR
jgi:predicted transcriptional regulator